MTPQGVFWLAELEPLNNHVLISVTSQVPNAVICLIAGLFYHEIKTQIPHDVSFAVPQESRRPSLDYPLIEAHGFSKEEHQIDSIIVKIYSIEKLSWIALNSEIKLAWILSFIAHKKIQIKRHHSICQYLPQY